MEKHRTGVLGEKQVTVGTMKHIFLARGLTSHYKAMINYT